MKIRTVTINGTTNAQGAVQLSAVTNASTVLSVSTQGDANALCIPWLYNNSLWFAKVVDWRNLAVINQDMTLVVKYIPNGMI